MTVIKDALAALSEAATQGLVAFGTDRSHFDTACVVAEGGDVSANYYRRDADARFVVALWNAYRTSQLVPVPSVEAVARAIMRSIAKQDGHPNYDPPAEWDMKVAYLDQGETDIAEIATAVIAAIKDFKNEV